MLDKNKKDSRILKNMKFQSLTISKKNETLSVGGRLEFVCEKKDETGSIRRQIDNKSLKVVNEGSFGVVSKIEEVKSKGKKVKSFVLATNSDEDKKDPIESNMLTSEVLFDNKIVNEFESDKNDKDLLTSMSKKKKNRKKGKQLLDDKKEF